MGYTKMGSAATVLVTGATGFVGQHLLAWLMAQGYTVVAHSIPGDPLAATLPQAVHYVARDVTDAEAVRQMVEETAPNAIFHLAGLVQSHDFQRLLTINVQGTDAVLRAAWSLSSPPTVVIPGSASEYGVLNNEEFITEDTPLKPISAYGVSKVAQTLTGLGYAWRGEVPVIIGRIFNITGPGEPDKMLGGAMASQIAAIEAGDNPPVLRVGNLTPYRDYVDIRDAVRALGMLWHKGKSGQVYNICSGKPVQVQYIVDTLVGLARCPIAVEPDPNRQRPSDIPFCAGSPARIHDAIGWTPEYTLKRTLTDTLDGWRSAYARH
ncbi:MAG: GDP-mannose 4,6-dehydratase [Anaerolineae bacterium]